MLHVLYILAFTVLAVLAVGNLIRNLLTLGLEESQRRPGAGYGQRSFGHHPEERPHPEMLDESGRIIKEPLMVMRSMTVEDARERLDALYNAPPGNSNDAESR